MLRPMSWLFVLLILIDVGPLAITQEKIWDASARKFNSRSSGSLVPIPGFKNVHATVEDNIVTLTGTVKLYIDKTDAERHIRHIDHVAGVRNQSGASHLWPLGASEVCNRSSVDHPHR